MKVEKSVMKSLVLNQKTKQKIEEKTEMLQFLPESLEELSKVKKVTFNSKNLKTSYLIDIVHTLIFKYYTKGDNFFQLNATLLREKYTKTYNYYMDYLVKNNHLNLIKDYSVGNSSKTYSLNAKIFNQKMKRYPNKERRLLEIHKSNLLNIANDENNLIKKEVKGKLIDDLYSVDIELDKVIFYLDNTSNDLNIYNKNMLTTESIKNGDIHYSFDVYGRMHTNFTTLKSFIRKNCLLIDGEPTTELDIHNSQPLFLTKLIIDSNSKWVNKEELEFFKLLTVNGKYYEYMKNRFNIKDKKVIKKFTYNVLFGKNSLRNKPDRMFNQCFPTIYNFIKLYKSEHKNYKMLSHDLQRAESNFIFNNVVSTIMNLHPEVKIITIHDSIMIPSKYKDIIEPIFKQKLSEEFDF